MFRNVNRKTIYQRNHNMHIHGFVLVLIHLIKSYFNGALSVTQQENTTNTKQIEEMLRVFPDRLSVDSHKNYQKSFLEKSSLCLKHNMGVMLNASSG